MNIRQIPYRRRLFLVFAAAMLVVVIGWNLSISDTVELARDCKLLRIELNRTQNAPEELAAKTLQLEHSEKLIGKNNLHPDQVQQTLLNVIDGFGSRVGTSIHEVMPIHSARDDEFEITTHCVIVDGKFSNLARLGFELENQFESARLVAIHYNKETDRKSRKQRLLATFYLQNIRKP